MTVVFGVTLAALGLCGAFVSGLLGIGGAVVMIPLLLHVPPLLDVGALDVKAVTGVTMVQVFAAAVSGTLAHRRTRAVHGGLAIVGGAAMGIGALVGAVASTFVADRWLLALFAVMVTAALPLLLAARDPRGDTIFAEQVEFSRWQAATVCLGVGLAAGAVGAGGAFLLVPLLLVFVRIPIRVTIGSSLAITGVAALTGFAGKLATGQILWAPALLVALGAIPGARLGAMASRRLPGRRLQQLLFVVVLATAIQIWVDLLAP